MSHHRHWTGGMRADWRDIAGAFLAAQHGRSEDDRRGAGHGRGRWGGPRGGGRLLGHGDLRLLLLVLIGERPRHGYDLIRAIEERFAGAYTPSPGAVYPLLTLLEEQDLIRATPEGAKKLYAATPEGEAYLRENDAAVQGILTRVKLAATAYSSQTAPDTVWELSLIHI